MFWLMLSLALLPAPSQESSQERPRVPKDSIEVTVIGCLTGRALKASEVRQMDVESGPDVRSRVFRVAGKKDIMDVVKRENGHIVEVTGLVKRSSLDDKGVKVGRVEFGGGSPVAGSGRVPTGTNNVAVMDVSAIRARGTSCGE